ncbi:hypothetical protein K505DRAFT_382401 [Melanomma pulvis-pyrius CBS 109.77]|uniref:Fe2OG dioxygenase domain-containing protein n=1 Tax=Melanomma pulvis-pyrius CBS 109.77 TaxID=1314802 RepID=A0A6A6XIG6_9PLEO|nr:hypothetical protein K505DRAFT_382401 [Melanomma pulvis-pyrius CBS 109.77]
MAHTTKTTARLRDSISEALGSFVKSRSSTFACGGVVPLIPGGDAVSGSNASTALSLRWDSPTGMGKLSFPVKAATEEQKKSLLKLADDCQPASFGFKGQDVLDESYRKATKMDRSAFSIDFCPYELGIVDTIAQVLLPNAGGNAGTKGVKAELYKLNIYAAPSGFFKPHVDTPRSDTQFGSLVVSLPCHHEGGQLIVRHAEHSVTFDWGASGSGEKVNTSAQWAAFYSDCEHEVLEVTEGHRITLTYNLYYTLGVGDLAGNSPAMDVKSLPLYKKIYEALADAEFMADGGYLGICCQHAYAHSTPEGVKSLPAILKGSDMAVYSIFLALGLDISVRPILSLEDNWFFDFYDINDQNYVGDKLRQIKLTEAGNYEDEDSNEILREFGGKWLKVNWLTHPTSKNVGFVHMTYGNEPGINHVYTYAALFVVIPPAAERLVPKE